MNNKKILAALALVAFALTSCDDPKISTSTPSSSHDVSNYDSFVIEGTPVIENGTGTIESGGTTLRLEHVKDGGLFTLEKGGYLENETSFSRIHGIKVDYEGLDELNFVTVKASRYEISSNGAGAKEIASGVPYFFPNRELENSPLSYFSVYVPIGEVKIEAVTVYTEKRTEIKDNVPAFRLSHIDFYTMNDTHGAVEYIEDSRQAGIAKISSYVRNEAIANPDNSVILSSGDMWQGSADSNLTNGLVMVDWMNLVGFEAMAIGNHEFDWGADRIAENALEANYPFLGINILDPNNERPSWATPSIVTTRGDVKLGIVGGIGNLESSIAVSSLGGYSLADNYEELIENEAQRLKSEENCDVVVVSIHNGDFQTRPNTAIDAIFEGHTHSITNDVDGNGVLHVQTYANGSNVWKVRLNLDSDKTVVSATASEANFYSLKRLKDDAATKELQQHYYKEIETIKNRVVGNLPSGMSRSELAKLCPEVMWKYYDGSEYSENLAGAVVNTGCSRQSLPSGAVTYGDVYAALPFDNDHVLCEVSGSVLDHLLNVDTYVYTYVDPAIASSIDPNATYEIMVISYISEKPEYQAIMTETSRDSAPDHKIRDLVSLYFEGKI